MGRFSPDGQFSPRPIFAVGYFIHNVGTWIMGYDWGTDLYIEGMREGANQERDRAIWDDDYFNTPTQKEE